MWAQGKINIKRGEMMKISKEEKEVMKVLEELVSSTLADSDGCLLFKTDYEEPLKSIHKIYKPLLEDLKAENDRLKGEFDKYFSQDWVKNNSSMVNPNKKG